MGRWERYNHRIALIVFGLPVVLAVPAAISTVAAYGVWAALQATVIPVALICLPLLLWLRYRRSHGRVRARWAWLGLVALLLLLLSPLWWWVLPVTAVLVSEALRVLASRGPRRSRRSLAGRRVRPGIGGGGAR